ncbi:MAG: helix-turn-helix domain-containing protein [Hyphomicrobiales bacterium]|nr:helix-turn-helix domain-containing protein [Hyphomicrobiales bacterium]
MYMQTPLVMSPKQAAALLGLSFSTLAKMRLCGNGPAFSKLGRRVVYRPDDLDEWVLENRFKSTSEYPTNQSGDAS